MLDSISRMDGHCHKVGLCCDLGFSSPLFSVYVEFRDALRCGLWDSVRLGLRCGFGFSSPLFSVHVEFLDALRCGFWDSMRLDQRGFVGFGNSCLFVVIIAFCNCVHLQNFE